MGITEILTIIFVVLKAFNIVAFSWLQCFIPEIIAGVFYFMILIIYVIRSYRIKKEISKEFSDFNDLLK